MFIFPLTVFSYILIKSLSPNNSLDAFIKVTASFGMAFSFFSGFGVSSSFFAGAGLGFSFLGAGLGFSFLGAGFGFAGAGFGFSFLGAGAFFSLGGAFSASISLLTLIFIFSPPSFCFALQVVCV